MKYSALLLLLLAATAVSADQVYRWVDKNGNVHYSQTPPPASQVQVTKANINAPPPDAAAAKDAQNLVQQMKQRQQQEEMSKQQAQIEAQKQAQKQARCNDMMSQLQLLKQYGRVVHIDAKGNRTYLTDQQHQQEEQQLQNRINSECNSSE